MGSAGAARRGGRFGCQGEDVIGAGAAGGGGGGTDFTDTAVPSCVSPLNGLLGDRTLLRGTVSVGMDVDAPVPSPLATCAASSRPRIACTTIVNGPLGSDKTDGPVRVFSRGGSELGNGNSRDRKSPIVEPLHAASRMDSVSWIA